MNKNYTTSPLPFQGQKRNFIKQLKAALVNYPDNATYVDLFGGSGLLAILQNRKNQRLKLYIMIMINLKSV